MIKSSFSSIKKTANLNVLPPANEVWGKLMFLHRSGWPWHRENREFGSYFFQTGKTQGILFWHRENIWTVIINIKSMFTFLDFKNF